MMRHCIVFVREDDSGKVPITLFEIRNGGNDICQVQRGSQGLGCDHLVLKYGNYFVSKRSDRELLHQRIRRA